MPRIDSLLNLANQQGANELRLGVDREPQMFADGTPKRLTMAKTSMDTLRELLGELLAGERERLLIEQGQVQFVHVTPDAGNFRVTLVRRGSASAALEIDAVFLRARSKAVAAPPPMVAPRAAPTPTPTIAPPAPTASIAAAAPAPPRIADAPTPAAATGADVAPALAALIGARACCSRSRIPSSTSSRPAPRGSSASARSAAT